MGRARILLVDDYEPFRRSVCSMLERRGDFQVVGQASDGLEALQKATELQPDLILLDIGLPKLNGIETARSLRKLTPGARILFFSQHTAPDIVREAFRTGAWGYVHKVRTRSELLHAIEAVLGGRQFVSNNLVGWEFGESTAAPARHKVLLCPDDAAFLDGFTRVIAAALTTGNSAIMFATQPHRDTLLERLKAESVDADGAIRRGTYIPLDIAATLAAIMVGGLPDPERFFGTIGGFTEAAGKAAQAKQPRVAVCGEGLTFLLAEGKVEAALHLEQLCDELAETHKVDVFCAYPPSSFHSLEA
jgi:DNA-binding NarL/FixJ family response regulator